MSSLCSSGKGYPYSRYDVKFVALAGFENNLPLSVARRAYFFQKICHTGYTNEIDPCSPMQIDPYELISQSAKSCCSDGVLKRAFLS
jgi:hypothetical protein